MRKAIEVVVTMIKRNCVDATPAAEALKLATLCFWLCTSTIVAQDDHQLRSSPAKVTDVETNDFILFRLLDDASLDVAYFVDANGILGDQGTRLKNIISKYRRNRARSYLELQNRQATDSPNVGSRANDSNGDRPQFLSDLSDILLPHQIERMRQILQQRSLLQRGVRQYAIPLILAERLELSKQQTSELRDTVTREDAWFTGKKNEALLYARQRIIAELNPKLLEQLQNVVGDQFNEDDYYNSPYIGRSP